jgi:hypothetical protein
MQKRKKLKSRNSGRLLAAGLLLICVLFNGSCFAERESVSGWNKVGFWIGTDENGVFDEPTLRLIASRSGVFVLNAPLGSETGSYDYQTVVKRLRILRPDLPVLLYAWANQLLDSRRVGSAIVTGYRERSDLLLRDTAGRVLSGHRDSVFGDLTQEKYRKWILNRIHDMIRQTGTTGVALDNAIRTPSKRPLRLAKICRQKSKFCKQYAQGMDRLFASMRTAIAPRKLFYNGLWTLEQGLLEDQQKLLKNADGVEIEYFGMNPRRGSARFETDILPYLRAIERNPSKTILVYGRGPWSYNSYMEDILWQRYLYCAYLLAAGPKTYFKYHSSFQMPAHRGRSGGLDIYADWGLDIGQPLDGYRQKGDLYIREFTKALVLLVPTGKIRHQYLLPRPFYTVEGEKKLGLINIEPGEGLLLLKSESEIRKHFARDFEDQDSPFNSWRRAAVVKEKKSNRFLRLKRTAPEQQWEHDVMIDPERCLLKRSKLTIRVRTKDPKGKLMMVAEVDDDQKKHMRAIVVFSSNKRKPDVLSEGPTIHFRMQNRKKELPYVYPKLAITADGTWHQLEIDGDLIFRKYKRYRFCRWVFMRIIGDMDVDDINVQTKYQK